MSARRRTGQKHAKTDFAAPDAHTSPYARTKSFTREEADVPLLRPILDFRRADLSLYALDPAPPRDDRLHAGDQVDGLFRRERRVAARFPLPVQGRPGQDERGVDLEEVRPVVRIVEQRAEGIE